MYLVYLKFCHISWIFSKRNVNVYKHFSLVTLTNPSKHTKLLKTHNELTENRNEKTRARDGFQEKIEQKKTVHKRRNFTLPPLS